MQPYPTKELRFHETADTFDLTVTLNENNLNIVLKDFVEWAVYE